MQDWNTFHVGFLLMKHWTLFSFIMREWKFIPFYFLAAGTAATDGGNRHHNG